MDDMDLENYLLLEQHHQMASKRVAVAIGRFNPPTAGHYYVFDRLKTFIRKNPSLKLEATPIVLLISGKKTSLDKEKNPLSSEEIIKFIKASGRADGVLFVTGKNVIDGFNAMRKYGYEPIAFAAGEERADSYIGILDKYFRNKEGEKIKHYKIELDRNNSAIDGSEDYQKRMLERIKNGYEPDIDEISASLAKLAVKMNYEDVFAKIVGLEHRPTLAKKMFDKISGATK